MFCTHNARAHTHTHTRASHLLRQLAGRRENASADALARVRPERVDDRQHKGQGLSGTLEGWRVVRTSRRTMPDRVWLDTVPVGATPSTSRPWRRAGIACIWRRKG